jgi:hypothetical protein
MKAKRYRLPDGAYDPTFLKALACAIHVDKLDPSELEFWFEDGRDQVWIAKELYSRVKPDEPTKKKKTNGRYQNYSDPRTGTTYRD